MTFSPRAIAASAATAFIFVAADASGQAAPTQPELVQACLVTYRAMHQLVHNQAAKAETLPLYLGYRALCSRVTDRSPILAADLYMEGLGTTNGFARGSTTVLMPTNTIVVPGFKHRPANGDDTSQPKEFIQPLIPVTPKLPEGVIRPLEIDKEKIQIKKPSGQQ